MEDGLNCLPYIMFRSVCYRAVVNENADIALTT